MAGAGAPGLLARAPLPVSLSPLRRLITPALAPASLSGSVASRHVALTFDDGPDVRSTPAFLDALATRSVQATFFLLGAHLDDGLVREIAARGHECGVHGWNHRPVCLSPTDRLSDQLIRTRDRIESLTGAPVRWYRPPYGVLSAGAIQAARAARLDVVLWTAWGRDWERRATAATITRRVLRQVRAGGTILLHDSDRTSAPGSWRATLQSVDPILDGLAARDLTVGTLSEHRPV